jgi:glycosyltransferase involved in cell wall biosynthesis
VKLLITVPWGERAGGAEHLLWTFLRNVDRSRVEPTVVFFQYGSFEREVDALGIRTVVIPSGRLRQLRHAAYAVQSLRAVLRRVEPDLVLNWSAKTHLYGATAAAAAGVASRVVWWQHGIPNGHWLDRLATALPTRAIGCSSNDASEAQRRLRPVRPTFVVHPGIEAPFSPSTDRTELRNKLGLPLDRPIVGIVGRLQPWKGQHRVLHALARVREARESVHGLIVGGDAFGLSPKYERHLHCLAANLGLQEHVTFTGQVRNVASYFCAMDIFVNASLREPFGIVLLEAMAAGLPVVAFDSGGPREIVEHGRSGMLVHEGTDEALASAIETLIVDPQLAVRLGEAGRERFRRHFTAERMAGELEEGLEQLCR